MHQLLRSPPDEKQSIRSLGNCPFSHERGEREHILGPAFDHAAESRPGSTGSVATRSLRVTRAGYDCTRHSVPARYVCESGREQRPARSGSLAQKTTPSDDDGKAMEEFLQIYRLAPGQDLKLVESPRPAGAEVW